MFQKRSQRRFKKISDNKYTITTFIADFCFFFQLNPKKPMQPLYVKLNACNNNEPVTKLYRNLLQTA